ncbi:steroid 17-alpha-hydroxylase/17,20 lyase-like [Oppia nitens]|uniref:steroid 17-alpha-hydroxylase/17,20 lyase-like n=1 Tax=Oppia nitens TaxID=1686743 RepID=UPI0023DBEB42|nr:steroid 17-alpha-hydroxylase/17,20 lyase-like [Oppia nitens]
MAHTYDSFTSTLPIDLRSKLFHEDIARQLVEKYGPVFTKYTGNKPIVYVCNQQLANQVFNSTEYDFDDPELKLIKYFLHDFPKETDDKIHIWEASAVMRFLDRKLIARQTESIGKFKSMIIEKFTEHYRDYNPEAIERDICDSLITAKNQAISAGKQSAQYLTDQNLAICIYEMLVGGAEGAESTFRWLLLFMAYYPEVQQKLRHEVATVIGVGGGDRLPRHEDRDSCHYTMAFISEIMRFRTISPDGNPHKVLIDSKLGNYTIPKDTTVNVYQGIVMRNDDPNYWSRGLDFMPERFLDESDGHYRKPSAAYIPFGSGIRKCLGDKFVYSEMFLILVRLIQRTHRYDIVLATHNGIGINAAINDFCLPYDYTIQLKLRE